MKEIGVFKNGNPVVEDLIKIAGGINLDVGCGENKQANFLGMDKRDLPGVDIVHDLEALPYPLPDECCLNIVGSHIWEHLKPWLTVDIMNEWWRIMKPGGRLALVFPYGVNQFFLQDPTHCNPSNEHTWEYFDPDHMLWKVYKPKPWLIIHRTWQQTGIMEVLLEKRKAD